MNAVHYFEMFRYVTGETLASVQCWIDKEKVPNPRDPNIRTIPVNCVVSAPMVFGLTLRLAVISVTVSR